jgi:hypothetical protein
MKTSPALIVLLALLALAVGATAVVVAILELQRAL